MIYTNNKSKFIQFEVWKKCNNNCPFCFNNGLQQQNELNTLDFIYNFITSEKIQSYNKIGLIGGEIFNSQLSITSINEKFYKIIDQICKLIQKNVIVEFYISASLLYDLSILLVFLNFINVKDCISKMILCTSYDTIGRFHTHSSEELWKQNVKTLHKLFPKMRIHTEMILTDDLIDKISNDTLSIFQFSNEFQTSVDFLEPFSPWIYQSKQALQDILPKFFTNRQKFLNFLKIECLEKQKININKLFIPQFRSNYLYFGFNEKYVFIENRHIDDACFKLKVNNRTAKLGYIDSDIRMSDDVEQIRNAIV